jgi:hypothetical protein
LAVEKGWRIADESEVTVISPRCTTMPKAAQKLPAVREPQSESIQ